MRRILSVFVAWQLACWAVVGPLLAPVVPGGGWAVLGLAALLVVPIGAIVRQRQAGHYPGAASRRWLLRPVVYAQLLLPFLALGGIVGVLAGAAVGTPAAGGRWVMAAVAAAGAVIALMGYAGSRRLAVTHLVAAWPDLPPALDGLRIVQLSDTHVGPQTSRRHLARVARAVEQARPDLLVVTGDLVDDHVPDADVYAAALGHLTAPLGVFAVPGNHDVYAGWPALRARLAALASARPAAGVRAPLTVLVNEWRPLEWRGTRFVLLGTGDPAGGRGGSAAGGPDLPAAFAGVPADAFVIALAHNPALWPAVARGGARLTLSGHTHWGQLAIPALGWSLASPFNAHAMGRYTEGDALLYVHPGTNFWGIPFRLGTPAEVAVIDLRRTARAPAAWYAGGAGLRPPASAPAPAYAA